jgi:SAM-dependent methyltransferase
MKSYIASSLSPLERLNEARHLYLKHTQNVPENVRNMLEDARRNSAKIESLLGSSASGLKMLDIGPGQHLIQLAYFSVANEVTGIDLDVVLQQLSLSASVQMIRLNGWMRTTKTFVRKIAGIDRKVRSELISQLGVPVMPEFRLMQMDASRLQFQDNCFDVVYSRGAFEHISNPAAVISEIRRVLKPGGLMFVSLHLFTADTGSHDPRILSGHRGDLPFWAHLRPEHEHDVRPNSYLNKLRLADWVKLFGSEMPDCDVVATMDAPDSLRKELDSLRLRGQLRDYSDEELLTAAVEASWRKPAESG